MRDVPLLACNGYDRQRRWKRCLHDLRKLIGGRVEPHVVPPVNLLVSVKVLLVVNKKRSKAHPVLRGARACSRAHGPNDADFLDFLEDKLPSPHHAGSVSKVLMQHRPVGGLCHPNLLGKGPHRLSGGRCSQCRAPAEQARLSCRRLTAGNVFFRLDADATG